MANKRGMSPGRQNSAVAYGIARGSRPSWTCLDFFVTLALCQGTLGPQKPAGIRPAAPKRGKENWRFVTYLRKRGCQPFYSYNLSNSAYGSSRSPVFCGAACERSLDSRGYEGGGW